MEYFFTTIPGVVISLGAILAVVVTGLLYILGIYSKQKLERKKEEDAGDDRLIKLLQTTVTELEKKVNQQTLDIEELSTEVAELRKENKIYIDIFQGRDGDTKEFYKKAYEAIEIARQTHDLMGTVAESIKNTNSAMEKLIELIGKSMDIAGKIAIK